MKTRAIALVALLALSQAPSCGHPDTAGVRPGAQCHNPKGTTLMGWHNGIAYYCKPTSRRGIETWQ